MKIINSYAVKCGDYYYAGLKFFNSGEQKPFKTIEFPEPFIDIKTARKHAEFAAYEARNA